jgi:hypothetical protein
MGAAAVIAFALAAGPAYAQTQPATALPEQTAQVPQPRQGGVNWPGAGYGVAAVAGNILYIPAKTVYALLGAFVGGATWLLTAGNTQTADTVWRSSLGGDWVLTPSMVAGEQPINFSGPTHTPPVATAATPAPPTIAQQPAHAYAPAQTHSYAPAPAAGSTASYGAPGPHPMDSGSGPLHESTRIPEMTIE